MTRNKSDNVYREPIALSLTPTALQWNSAHSNVLSVLVDIFGNQGMFLVANGTSDAQVTYCRVINIEKKINLFIKIMPKRFASALQQSGNISQYLKDSGLLTPSNTPGFPKLCLDGRVMFSYPFIDGKYLNKSIGNLPNLGRALANLHKTLANFPYAHKVSRKQRSIRGHMRRKAKELLGDKNWASGNLLSIRTHILKWLEVDSLLSKSLCQVIHNDLNAGNVLLDNLGNIWFIDFEEARWSYLPYYFDIAKVIERFVLVNEEWNVEMKFRASKQLLNSYRSVIDENHRIEFNIPIALAWLLGFSWLRMADLLFDSQASFHPEVSKFRLLAKLLDENESWLAEL